jgi:nucleoside 2-deoxyribosyltransferase
MNLYIATQKQENAKPVRDAILADGHSCNASWIDLAGYASIPGDDEHRKQASLTCEREVRDCDALILVAEPDGERVRGGKHVETGMAIALGKPVYVVNGPWFTDHGKRENVFHWHPLVTVVPDIDGLIRAINTKVA